jgi:hypothetical protein
MSLFLKQTHKQCISQVNYIQLHWHFYPPKPYTLKGFEPGSSVPEAGAMSTVPRRHQGNVSYLHWPIQALVLLSTRFGTFNRSVCFVQGCQMVYFQTKNSNLGKFWRVLQRKMLVYFMSMFGLFYGHWKYVTAIWYILWPFGLFFPVLVCCTKKNLATLAKRNFCLAVLK